MSSSKNLTMNTLNANSDFPVLETLKSYGYSDKTLSIIPHI
jgi:hypothetical protein